MIIYNACHTIIKVIITILNVYYKGKPVRVLKKKTKKKSYNKRDNILTPPCVKGTVMISKGRICCDWSVEIAHLPDAGQSEIFVCILVFAFDHLTQ